MLRLGSNEDHVGQPQRASRSRQSSSDDTVAGAPNNEPDLGNGGRCRASSAGRARISTLAAPRRPLAAVARVQRRTRRLARNDVLRSSRIAVDGRLKRCFVGCSPGWWGDGRPEDTLMKLIIVAGASAIVGAVAIGLYVVTRAGAVCPVQNEAFYDHSMRRRWR